MSSVIFFEDMDIPHQPPFEAFVPVLAWPGRRPSLAELATWHEALTDAVGVLLPFDLMACWLYPSRGGSVLIGPPALATDRVIVPVAEPLVQQEGIFALEDRIRWAGYRSVLGVPIRAEVQDVGMIVVASFEENRYSLDDSRIVHRVAAAMSHSCRRLAAHLWMPPQLDGDDPNVTRMDITERILDATARARDGADLVQLASDAISTELPHDRLELIAVAPAPECWALLGMHRSGGSGLTQLDPDSTSLIDALAGRVGSREIARIADLRDSELRWPAAGDQRGAERLRSMLAVRLEVAGAIVGWLWLGSETPGWFRDADEELARHVGRLLSASVAAWMARTEQAGVWR